MNNKKISLAARALAIGVVAALMLVGTAGAEVIFQDDFEKDLSKWTVGTPTNSEISSNLAHAGKSSLEIKGYPNPDIKVRYIFSEPVQGKLTVWYYDSKGEWPSSDMILLYTDATYGKRGVGIGIFDDDYTPRSYYRIHQLGGFGEVGSNTPRSKGWHKFELDVSDDGTKYIIDNKVQSYIANDKRIYGIRFDSGWNKNSIAYWDDLSFEKPSTNPSLTLTKSLSPSTITEGDSTTVTNRVENTGGDAKSVKIIDTIPQGFTLVSGSASQEYATLKATESRTFQYTIKATGTGRFVSDLATVTYQDDKGNSYSGASNSATITVQAGQAGQVPAAQPKTPGFGAILAGIGIILALAYRRR